MDEEDYSCSRYIALYKILFMDEEYYIIFLYDC